MASHLRSKSRAERKQLSELIASSDILFLEDTAIVHISGGKDNSGNILKANQGLLKVFGYSKSELVGHPVNVLMPKLFAVRHKEFLEKFFKTGHSIIFNKENVLYGLHKNGCCFCLKIVVKQLPTCEEGIEYVGMLRSCQDECDYILTDHRGVIDCCSSGILPLLSIPVSVFKESKINIQILAPELIKILNPLNNKERMLSKYQEAGGRKLVFVIPKEFITQAQLEAKKNSGYGGSGKGISQVKKAKTPLYWKLNSSINNNLNNRYVIFQQLLQSAEYKECEARQVVKCEINELTFGAVYKDIEPLKLKVFKIFSTSRRRIGSSDDSPSETHSVTKFSNNEVEVSQYDKEGLMHIMEGNSLRTGEVREDTKVTEKLPGNFVTTEKNIETVEAPPLFVIPRIEGKLKEERNTTGKTKKRMGPVHSESQFLDKQGMEFGLGSNIDDLSSKQRKHSVQSLKGQEMKMESQNNTSEQKSKEDLTPRLDLGQIKMLHIPSSLSHILDSPKSNEDSVLESEVSKASAQLNPKKAAEAKQVSTRMELDANQREVSFSKIVNNGVSKVQSYGNMKMATDRASRRQTKNEAKKTDSISGQNGGVAQGTRRRLRPKTSMSMNLKDLQAMARGKSFEKEEAKPRKYYKGRILKNLDDVGIIEGMESKVTEDEIQLRQFLIAHEKKVKPERKNVVNDKEDLENSKGNIEKTIENNSEGTYETQSSVTSSKGGGIKRSCYSLRAAIDEKYTPAFFRRMGHCANFVFLTIFGIATGIFAVQLLLYRDIEKDFHNIESCKVRIKETVELCLNTYNLALIGASLVQKREGLSSTFVQMEEEILLQLTQVVRQEIKAQATALKEAQFYFSKHRDQFKTKTFNQLNPSELRLKVLSGATGVEEYVYSMWQGISEIAASAFRVAEADVVKVNDTADPTVYFLTKNSINTILVNLDDSSLGVVQEVYDTKELHKIVFITLLAIASASIFVCAVPICVVMVSVNKDREYTLELFMYIKKRHANDEARRHKKFLEGIQGGQEYDAGAELLQEEAEEGNEPDENGYLLEGSKRKAKKLSYSLGIDLFKLLVFILVIEGYFIVNYLLSYTFLNRLTALASEFDLLSSRFPENTLLYLAQK